MEIQSLSVESPMCTTTCEDDSECEALNTHCRCGTFLCADGLCDVVICK